MKLDEFFEFLIVQDMINEDKKRKKHKLDEYDYDDEEDEEE